MKKIFLVACATLLLTEFNTANAQVDNPAQATQWFNQGRWLQGLKLKPHPSINKLEFARQYLVHNELWVKALAFLKNTDLENLAPGEYRIAGDSAVVKVSEGPGKDEEHAKWEAHRKFVDIQYVAAGKEKIGVAPLSKATPISNYDAPGDVTNYTADGTYFEAAPGTFFIFFPSDVHRPGLKLQEGNIKKIVIKILFFEE